MVERWRLSMQWEVSLWCLPCGSARVFPRHNPFPSTSQRWSRVKKKNLISMALNSWDYGFFQRPGMWCLESRLSPWALSLKWTTAPAVFKLLSCKWDQSKGLATHRKPVDFLPPFGVLGTAPWPQSSLDHYIGVSKRHPPAPINIVFFRTSFQQPLLCCYGPLKS